MSTAAWSHTKEIAIFILSVTLFASPVILLLQSQFLNTENFGYKFGAGVVNAILQVFSFVLFPFFISLGRKLAWRAASLVFLSLNITWAFFSNFSFDEYEKTLNMYNLDPVISEYNETFEELSFKEDIPTFRVFYWNNNGRQSGFWVQDITSPAKPISERTEGNAIYIKSLKDNLDLLDKRISHAKFQRNKEMFIAWKDYFQNVQPLYNVNEFSGADVKMLLRDYQIGMDSINGHPQTFLRIDINPVVKVQANLKMRHNATVNAFDYSEIPVIVANRIRYFLGYVIDGVYVDYLQKHKSKPYTDRFNTITSGF